MPTLPSLFVPHGAPTFALSPGEAGVALAQLALDIGKPSAILVVSPHWDTAFPKLGGALAPETIHDFNGFARELYGLRYPVAGNYALASRARDLLEDAGFVTGIALERGLDHGAWIPLRHMYPAVDVPVVPLSVQSAGGPAHHFALGRALAPLRTEGVLILATGNVTHNLDDFRRHLMSGGRHEPSYLHSFPDWLNQQLSAGDASALLDYRQQAPGAVAAHPSEEHLLPLFVALGAAGENWQAEAVYRGISDGVLAMDSYCFPTRADRSVAGH